MADNSNQQARLAVLVDADNASPNIIEGLIAEIAKYGVASVKRIYGDWTTPNLSGWKPSLLDHSILPVQQFRYTVGKNATDSAMIIDAMDLMYTRRFDGFCLVSSDSDFTRLAARIREEGLMVYGFGERKTPKPFVSACHKFVFTELLRETPADETSVTRQNKTKALNGDNQLINLLRGAINARADEDGWAQLSGIGSAIAQASPEFDPRNHGFGRLSDLMRAITLFEVSERTQSDGHSKTIYVRDKRKKEKT
ncbi:MAG TPA: NYN domain-containing protein [Rhodocyclaceae bacterium]|nr:NYN domain-containing protein [Rhodocyclaceae bacterium]